MVNVMMPAANFRLARLMYVFPMGSADSRGRVISLHTIIPAVDEEVYFREPPLDGGNLTLLKIHFWPSLSDNITTSGGIWIIYGSK